MQIGAGNNGLANLDRLTKRFQNLTVEFRQFVKKENAEMGKRNFPRLCPPTTAHHRRDRGGMMRIAKRTAAREPPLFHFPGDAGNHVHLQRLGSI